MKTSVLWDITQCISVKVKVSEENIDSILGSIGKPISCRLYSGLLAYSLALNMEAIYSSETLVDFHRSTKALYSRR
jgi:hypothetical protein